MHLLNFALWRRRYPLAIVFALVSMAVSATAEPQTYDLLVARFQALKSKEASFGPDYQPIYHAAIAWYETWGNHTNDPADKFFVQPNDYAAEFADAVEHGHNYIGEHLGSAFPLAFEGKLLDGTVVKANYQLSFPAGFPQSGRKFPLIIGLHGSGWLGHKISYVRGGTVGGRAFQVTPINQGGPWKIDFLNAYLDELLRILPIDPDKVYVEGHSLGAMATWDWAMHNPEHFAAISPRDGSGSAFRAARLKNVPAWVIHGSADDVILPGFADQMVSALQSAGCTVKYSLLKGAPHNLPADFDQQSVITWYLQQTRNHEPVPADPLDGLNIDSSGFSPTTFLTLPAAWYWKSATVPLAPERGWRSSNPNFAKELFAKVEDKGALVDSPIRTEIDPQKELTTSWLSVPETIHESVKDDTTIVKLPARQVARFYGRGGRREILAHANEVLGQLKSQGKAPSNEVWLTNLTPEMRDTNHITECWITLR